MRTIYILSYCLDGGGGPEMKFFPLDKPVDAVNYAIEKVRSGQRVVCADVPAFDYEAGSGATATEAARDLQK